MRSTDLQTSQIVTFMLLFPTALTLTVAGTLREDATVTVSEMQEHVFYQLLNLAQALSL